MEQFWGPNCEKKTEENGHFTWKNMPIYLLLYSQEHKMLNLEFLVGVLESGIHPSIILAACHLKGPDNILDSDQYRSMLTENTLLLYYDDVTGNSFLREPYDKPMAFWLCLHISVKFWMNCVIVIKKT